MLAGGGGGVESAGGRRWARRTWSTQVVSWRVGMAVSGRGGRGRGGRGGRGAASHEMSKLNDRRPVPGACRAREMGLLGSEKGEEEESRPRCPGWI
jgi:hypothetical protein